MTLPDCPFCDNDATLRPERAEPRGVKVCVCARCATRLRIDADGHIIAVSEGSAAPQVERPA